LNRNYPTGAWEVLADSATNSGVFAWTVSGSVTSSARIRITGISSPSVGDTSDGDFSIAARTITVLQPNGGELLILSEPYSVRWSAPYLAENVKIEVHRSFPTGDWEVLAASAPNSGEWTWQVNGPNVVSGRIRITGVTHTGVSDMSDGDFTTGVRSITLSSPQGGESWMVGQYRTITWTQQNLTGLLAIDLNRAYPTGAWETIDGAVANVGSYTWRVTDPATTQARLRLRSLSYSAVADTSDGSITILPAQPGHEPGYVSHPFPSDSSLRIPPTPFLSWFPADSAEFYDVYLWPDTSLVPVTPIVSGLADTYYQIGTSLLYGQRYLWKVVARNFYGQTSGPIWSFTVRALPNLTPTTIQLPQQVYTEHSYQITWFVRNAGLGSTVEPSWTDAVYLSSVPAFGPQATYLGQFGNVSALAPGESYANTATFTIPRGTMPGRYYIFVRADYGEQVLESNEMDNRICSTDTMQALLTPPPDLIVSHILAPNEAWSGNQINVTWTVRNQGPGSTVIGNWSDLMVLSGDTLAGNDSLLGRFPHSGLLQHDSSYTASATVTLPNKIWGNYYILVRTDTYGQVYEFLANDNNWLHSDSFEVRLTPPPDLVVREVQVPPDGISGQPVEIGWTVLNQGSGAPFETGWNDRVYLSSSSTFNAASAITLGTFARSGILAPSGTYLRQETITLPQGLSGAQYIHVQTDCDHQVFEYLDETNNITSSSTPLELELLPWPDLVTDSVQAPTACGSGDSVRVRWRVMNRGSVVTPVTHWRDRVYLSSNSVFSPDSAVPIHSYDHSGALESWASYHMDVWTVLPDSLVGTYFIFVVSDADYEVYEYHDEGNNAQKSDPALVINLTPWPDLIVESLTAGAATSGDSVTIGWTVHNQGTGITRSDTWTDRIYLYNRTTLVQDSAYQLGSFVHAGRLSSNEQYVGQRRVLLPNRIAGPYYLFVVTDAVKTVFEYLYEGNNTTRTESPLNILPSPYPDLIVGNVTVPPNAMSGQQVTVEWSVRNQGSAPTAESFWTDRVYLSTQPLLDTTTAILQGTPAHSGILSVGGSYIRQMDVVLPNGYSGSSYIHVLADWGNRVYEYQADTNNLGRSAPISVSLAPWPDLQITSIQAPGSARAGDSLAVRINVSNLGQASTDASSWTDNFYLLPSDVWNPGTAVLLRSVARTGILAPDSVYSVTSRVFIPPQIAGSYYLHMKTDAGNAVFEYSDESNNVSHSAVLAVEPYPPVDLTVQAIACPDLAWSGQPLNIEWTVANIGHARTLTSSWQDIAYLSLDTLLDLATDIPLLTSNHAGALDSAQNYTRQQSVTLPNGFFGDYYLLVNTDAGNLIGDSNPVNNTRVRQPVLHIVLTPPPDLQVVTINAQPEVNAGQPLHVSWVVQNTGTGSISGASWNDGVYLSLNAQLDGADTRLATVLHGPALAAGDIYLDSLDLLIPSYVPGTYYLLVKTDTRGDVYEYTGESNNATSKPLSVQTPLMADLAISDISIPDSAAPGDSVIVSWTLTNRSQNAAVGWIRDAVYFSADSVWTAEDPMLGYEDRYISLTAGNNVVLRKAVRPDRTYRPSAAFEIGGEPLYDATSSSHLADEMPGVPLGWYHAIVRTDLRNSLPETSEQNNSGYSIAALNVGVPTLPLGTPISSIVGVNQLRYYRVDAEAGLDLRLTASSPLSDACDELYVAHDRVPSLSDYDACGTSPFTAGQDVLLASTQAGTYYIMAMVRSLPSGTDSVSLTVSARALHFSALSITPAGGGAGGRVTCHVNGAGFDSTMQLSLVSEDALIPGVLLAVPNRMEAVVNWNLQGVPIGHCDLIISRADSSRDTLRSAFAVVPASGSLDLAIDGPSLMRTNRDYRYGVYAYSSANTDFINARILVQIPAGVEYRLGDSPDYVASPADAVIETMILQAYPGSTQSIELSLRSEEPLGMSSLSAALVEPGARMGFESGYLGHLLSFSSDTGYIAPPPSTSSAGYDSTVLWDWASAGAGYIEYFRTYDADSTPAGDAWGVRLDGDSVAILCGQMAQQHAETPRPGTGVIQIFRMVDLMSGSVPLWDGRALRFEHCFSVRPTTKENMPSFADRVKRNLLLRESHQISLCEHPGINPLTGHCSVCNDQCSSSLDNAMWLGYHGDLLPALGVTIEDVMQQWLVDSRALVSERADLLAEYNLARTKPAVADSLRRRIRDGRTIRIRLVASQDPDAISGPIGYGDEGWVAVEEPCGYTVHYENQVERATAPAQKVRVTVQIDSAVNMNSFRLGRFGFANMTFDVPENCAYYAQRLDLRDSLGVFVDVIAGIDINARQAFWTLESVDPATGEPPTDPMTGLLPINDTLSHRGEGFASYTISPRSDAPTGTILNAKARIVFDVNDPLDTAPIFNTLDAGNPTSRMDTNVILLDSATFVVRWSGQDDANGSGVAAYDLYVSYNGGSFELTAGMLTDTAIALVGDLYNVYDFFTLAHDNVGHVEAMKSQSESRIALSLGSPARPVRDLTIHVQRLADSVVTRLVWSPVTEDITGRNISNVGYRLYSRFGALNRNGVWRQVVSTTDTSYSFSVPPTEEAQLVRLFQVVAVTQNDGRMMSSGPRLRGLSVVHLRSQQIRTSSPPTISNLSPQIGQAPTQAAGLRPRNRPMTR
jgi:subtilase family serine protease